MTEENGGTPDHKKRHRSPNYPTVGLREAVERLKNFYSRDGKAGAPADIAAVHIGFSRPHGQAMSVLAALKRFGLVSEANGRIVPSQRGIEIANLREDDTRRIAAIQAALVEPSIYRELIEQHRESGWPDADVLERELITYKNFNPNSAGGFVKDLFDSIEFAGLSDLSTLELSSEENQAMSGATKRDPERQTVEANSAVPAIRPRNMAEALTAVGTPIAPPSGVRQDVFSLSEGPVTIQWPASLSADSYQDVADWLEIVKRKIGRSVVKAEPRPPIDFSRPSEILSEDDQ